jgi:copper chaperone CopZ
MKKMFVFVAVMLFVISANAQVKSASLTASGLTCSMCSKAIYDAIKKVDFVSDVQANIKTSTYKISFKENADVQPDVISKAVKDAGFSVAKLDLLVNFNNQAVEKDAHIKIGEETFHFINAKQQSLSGEKAITLVDKAFLSAKEYKKYAGLTTMKCFTTGVMESCCDKTAQKGSRIYHVII